MPPPPPEPPPGALDGDAQGSVVGEALPVAVADELGVIDAPAPGVALVVGFADVAGVGDAASARFARVLDIPLSTPSPLEEAEPADVGEAAGGGEDDCAGKRPFVRSHTSDCNDGAPPDVEDDDGDGEALGPGDDAAPATAAGVKMTAMPAASPSVTRFIVSTSSYDSPGWSS